MPSALPSAMLRKKEQLEKRLAEQKDKAPVILNGLETAPKEDTAEKKEELSKEEMDSLVVKPEEPAPSEEKVTSSEPTDTQTEQEDDEKSLRWKYKALQGSHEVLVRENKEMRNRFVELEAKIEELKAELAKQQPPQQETKEPDLELTPEEKETYAESLPVINKLLAANEWRIHKSIIEPLKNEIENLKKNNRQVVDQIAAVDSSSFLQQVKARVKDFDAKVASPEWRDFLSKPVSPYTQITIGEALWNEGHQKRNLPLVLQIFEDFEKSRKNNVTAAYAAPPVSAASGSLANGVTDKKPILKMSARRQLHDDFKKGRITFSKYQTMKALFDEAEKEGRIDYDK
jgi:hypothetical protein